MLYCFQWKSSLTKSTSSTRATILRKIWVSKMRVRYLLATWETFKLSKSQFTTTHFHPEGSCFLTWSAGNSIVTSCHSYLEFRELLLFHWVMPLLWQSNAHHVSWPLIICIKSVTIQTEQHFVIGPFQCSTLYNDFNSMGSRLLCCANATWCCFITHHLTCYCKDAAKATKFLGRMQRFTPLLCFDMHHALFLTGNDIVDQPMGLKEIEVRSNSFATMWDNKMQK